MFQSLWERGQGPVTKLAPPTRLLVACILLAVCLISAPETAVGLLFIFLSICMWLFACRIPVRVLWPFVRFGLIVFLPFFLLAPLINVQGAPLKSLVVFKICPALLVPWGIFAKGMSSMLISIAAFASMSNMELFDGLNSLLPRFLAVLLIQIIHQTGALIDETRRIRAAMLVRGAQEGLLTAWQVLSTFPQAWLPRVIFRAERIAAAMELRGYDSSIPCFKQYSLQLEDRLAILSALIWLISAAVFGWRRFW